MKQWYALYVSLYSYIDKVVDSDQDDIMLLYVISNTCYVLSIDSSSGSNFYSQQKTMNIIRE